MACNNTTEVATLGCCGEGPVRWLALAVRANQGYSAWSGSRSQIIYQLLRIHVAWHATGDFAWNHPDANQEVTFRYDPRGALPGPYPVYEVIENSVDPAQGDYSFQGSAWLVSYTPEDAGADTFTDHRVITGIIPGLQGELTATITISLEEPYADAINAKQLLDQKDLLNEPLPVGCTHYTWQYQYIAGLAQEVGATHYLDSAPWEQLLGLGTNNPAQRVISEHWGTNFADLGGYGIYRTWAPPGDDLLRGTILGGLGISGFQDFPNYMSVSSIAQKIRLTSLNRVCLRLYTFGFRPYEHTAWDSQVLNPTCSRHLPIHHATEHPICPAIFKADYLELHYAPPFLDENELFTLEFNCAPCPP